MKPRHDKVAAALCGELGDDDGVDPRMFFRREDRRRDQTRKDRQLCQEVYRALVLALRPLEREDWAEGIGVTHVEPAPDASRLRVWIGFAIARASDEIAEALTQLERCKGSLRAEIATAIHRKRVPELTFALDHDGEPTANGSEVTDG